MNQAGVRRHIGNRRHHVRGALTVASVELDLASGTKDPGEVDYGAGSLDQAAQ